MLSIIEQPYQFDFAKNNPSFIVSGNKRLSLGQTGIIRYKINTIPVLGTEIRIQLNENNYTFKVTTSVQAQNEAYKIGRYTVLTDLRDELILKIGQNYYISQLFVFTAAIYNSEIALTFTAKTQTQSTFTLSSTENSLITYINEQVGIAPTYKDNYKVFAQFEIEKVENGAIVPITTPEMYFDLDDQNRVNIPLKIPNSYFDKIDIPSLHESFSAYPLQYLLLKYRLKYAEFFGVNPLVNFIKYSNYKLISNGKIEENNTNFADWDDQMGGINNQISYYDQIRSYGSPSGKTYNSFSSMPQWAYFMFCDFRLQSNVTKSCTVKVDIHENDGTVITDISIGSFTVANYTVVRVPISVDALNLSNHSTNILSYTVRIYHTVGQEWKRTFFLNQKPYFAKVFLFTNRFGVLDSFFIDNELTEKIVEGDEIILNDSNEVNRTNVETIYTARTGAKNKEEMKLLSSAVESRFNFRIENDKIERIVILPDTFQLNEEAEDLQSTEFRYVLQIESISGGDSIEQDTSWKDEWEDTIGHEEAERENRWDDRRMYDAERIDSRLNL